MSCNGCPPDGRCGFCGVTRKRERPTGRDIPTNLPTTGTHKETT